MSSFYVALWITLSGTVIIYNKWILAYYGFPYPITLTMWHMAFSAVIILPALPALGPAWPLVALPLVSSRNEQRLHSSSKATYDAAAFKAD